MTNSKLSLRQQIALAKTLASTAPTTDDSASCKPLVRTKFRRKKTGFDGFAEGHAPDALEAGALWRRARRGAGDDLPDGKYELSDPLVLIDAYNVIGAWAKLRKFRTRGDMGGARDALVHVVAEFQSVRGWQCVVVFDANGNANACKLDNNAQGVDVVFTGSETADTYIERRVFELCEAGERQVWVATNDVAEKRFAEAKGAHVISCSLFVQEMKRARMDAVDHVNATCDESTVAGKMLIRNVDAETREKLYKLRAHLAGVRRPPLSEPQQPKNGKAGRPR
jgi:uncharacterized protein